MKILALLNRDGGSLKTTDLGQLTTLMQDEFRMHGHELTVDDCSGDEIVAAIGKAAERGDIDVLLVGGGDGAVSAAATALALATISISVSGRAFCKLTALRRARIKASAVGA